ncbi:hypothetical protein VNO78_18590 [Psophocarpus tetragonolobus]|uniref:Uncharacterized protein n=1 Tax=Psophocarpus tetragonolobus TaxID=3891 RepID=A0AAN9SIQ9_PSOTE
MVTLTGGAGGTAQASKGVVAQATKRTPSLVVLVGSVPCHVFSKLGVFWVFGQGLSCKSGQAEKGGFLRWEEDADLHRLGGQNWSKPVASGDASSWLRWSDVGLHHDRSSSCKTSCNDVDNSSDLPGDCWVFLDLGLSERGFLACSHWSQSCSWSGHSHGNLRYC